MSNKSTRKKNKKKGIVKTGFWQQKELWMPIVGILAITFLLFSRSINSDFVNWDDDVNIEENANVQALTAENVKNIFTETVIGGYNPLTTLTFAIEKHFAGLNPSVFHFNNILLHLICTFFVYRIMLLLGLSRMAAAFAALLFGIHPMRVESVTWITERKDVLFGAFYLAALFLYTRSVKNKEKAPHLWILPLFILSLFSKIQAVSLPLSMLAVDYYFNRPLKFKLIIEKIPYFVLSLVVGLLGIYLLKEADTIAQDQYYGFLDRILIGMYSLCIYLAKFIFPYEMVPLYPYPNTLPIQVYIAPVIFLALVAGVYQAYRKDYKMVVFAAAFFIFNIMFVLQVVGAGQGYLADRFTYIPYIGLFFLLAYAGDYLSKNSSIKMYLPMIAGGYLLLMGITTYMQQDVWKNSVNLWTHVLKYYENTERPWGNLAHHYRENGDYENALKYYSGAIDRKPSATLYNGRGKAYFDQAIKANAANPPRNVVAKAIEDYTNGVKLDPKLAEARINRGAAFASIGRFDEALNDLNEGLKQEPDNSNAYLNRSLIFSIKGQHAKAVNDQNEYLKRKPNANPDMYYERGLSLMALGRAQEAADSFTEAIKRNRTQPIYFRERAKAYKALGDVSRSNADADMMNQLRGK